MARPVRRSSRLLPARRRRQPVTDKIRLPIRLFPTGIVKDSDTAFPVKHPTKKGVYVAANLRRIVKENKRPTSQGSRRSRSGGEAAGEEPMDCLKSKDATRRFETRAVDHARTAPEVRAEDRGPSRGRTRASDPQTLADADWQTKNVWSVRYMTLGGDLLHKLGL